MAKRTDDRTSGAVEERSARTLERILLVEDDESLSRLLADEIGDGGFEVLTAHSAEEARGLVERETPDLVISDVRLPGADGGALLAYARALDDGPAFIVITAFGTVDQAVECLKMGAEDFLTKPIDLDHLMLSVRRALETRRLRRQLRHLQEVLGSDDFHGLLGRSPPMRRLFDQITHIGRASGPVLVMGESGVGKELVARAVHAESSRGDAPFVAVNCAGIPSELLESEFFGHEAGAFTGASKTRTGLFEEASGGTLFLDEIAEMPGALQAKLLRVLQDGKVRPVGGNRERQVDVRIVAATNRDLEEEMEGGRFREDLFYRLETFKLEVPALRDRGDDLELLAAHFVHKYRATMGHEIVGLSESALRRLREYSFPGNVRELQNVIERAVAFCHGGEILLEHLPPRMRRTSVSAAAGGRSRDALEPLVWDDSLPTLAEIERRYIAVVLDRVEGNKRQAAKILGIGRRTLYRRLGEGSDSSDRASEE
ncbi:MAG: sigma-54 dependent transcriptional regulator [Gemmatimonadota bacterium]